MIDIIFQALQTVPDGALPTIWAGYLVVRIETLARHHRRLATRVKEEHRGDEG